MQSSQPAKILGIHLLERDQFLGKPLYEAIVDKCRKFSIAGATVFRGIEGYGDSAEIHRHHLLGHDQPLIVTIIDSEEKIRSLLPVLEEMMETGLITVGDVEVVRITKK